MSDELEGRRVAILVADGFEQAEMMGPKRALDAAGALTSIVSLHAGSVQGWEHDHPGDAVRVDITVATATADNFDALLVPGTVLDPDALRHSPSAIEFVRGFFRAGKPVAVNCHGLSTMLEAGVIQGRTVTSFPSLRSDVINAGASWVDAAVVVDHRLVTSRSPADREDFKVGMIEEFAGVPRPATRSPREDRASRDGAPRES